MTVKGAEVGIGIVLEVGESEGRLHIEARAFRFVLIPLILIMSWMLCFVAPDSSDSMR